MGLYLKDSCLKYRKYKINFLLFTYFNLKRLLKDYSQNFQFSRNN